MMVTTVHLLGARQHARYLMDLYLLQASAIAIRHLSSSSALPTRSLRLRLIPWSKTEPWLKMYLTGSVGSRGHVTKG